MTMTTHPLFTRLVEPAPAFVLEEQLSGPNETPIHSAVRDILMEIGEDPFRQGLLSTPDRVARMYQEITSGYQSDPVKLVNGAIFDVEYSEPVVVKDIEFYSLCEHHMLPFFGRVHVAYIPDGKVIGLSKIPRIVEMYARRLQIQERMTAEIARFLDELLHPKGVAVVADGAHMCSMMRGVKKSQASMTTSSYLGAFQEDRQLRAEFLSQIARGRSDS
jgi:GTP cyclohydrolase IA